jgi:hypothetical protein
VEINGSARKRDVPDGDVLHAVEHSSVEFEMGDDEPQRRWLVVGVSGGARCPKMMFRRLADEAEAGFDVEVLKRRGGRRRMGSAPAEVVPVRIDQELKAAIDTRVDAENVASTLTNRVASVASTTATSS